MVYRIICCFILLQSISYAQDSLNMTRVGQWNPSGMPSSSGVTYNDIWGYTASDGSEYAIIGNVDSILVVDVTQCDDPQRVYGFDGGGTTIWRDFKTHQDHLYAVCDNCNEGLHVFDLSGLPSSGVSHVLTTTTFFNDAHNIFIDTTTNKLYAAGGDGASEGLTILDISTPSNPTLIDDIEFDDVIGMPSMNFYVHDVYVQNDTAYCSHGYTGFYVWDLTNLNSIDLLGSYDSPGYNHSSWIDASGQYSYYAEEVPLGRPMAVVDLTNLGDPVNDIMVVKTFKDPISTSDNKVTPHNPFVYNDSLFISYYEDGIKVYDLINPASPTLVGYYDTYPDNGNVYSGYDGNWGTYPFLSSGCILASDIKYGLNTINYVPCSNPVTYYRDSDGDDFGDPNMSFSGCAQPEGWVIDNTDCDDTDPQVNPNALELCDGIDNDCDGLIDGDDPDAQGTVTYYRDDDGDGFGNALVTVQDCGAPAGFVTDNTDCDDSDPNNFPGNAEICDGQDNDCDGLVDDNDPNAVGLTTFFEDLDGDGFGNADVSVANCSAPTGYVLDNTDCNDNDPNINPSASEICDGLDNDCDALVDGDDPSLTGGTIYYLDSDGDAFGNPNVTIIDCSQPTGYVLDNTDCDDSNQNVFPGNVESCDGIDNNCNNIVDEGCVLEPCDGINLNINPITQNIYHAKQTIDSDAQLNAGQDIEFNAGNNIDLTSGFEVPSGAMFLAQIKDCDDAASVPGQNQQEGFQESQTKWALAKEWLKWYLFIKK